MKDIGEALKTFKGTLDEVGQDIDDLLKVSEVKELSIEHWCDLYEKVEPILEGLAEYKPYKKGKKFYCFFCGISSQCSHTLPHSEDCIVLKAIELSRCKMLRFDMSDDLYSTIIRSLGPGESFEEFVANAIVKGLKNIKESNNV